MDRYLRYDKSFDGMPPKLYYYCKILNKKNEVIGLRFKDKNQPVYIDIPIQNIYTLIGEVTQKYIKNDIKNKLRTNAIMNFVFFGNSMIPLIFNESEEKKTSLHLEDNFSYPNSPKEITSIYTQRCVFRYENEYFANNGISKLFIAMDIIYNKDFQRLFQPFHVEHIRFIENDDNVTVYMKSRLHEKLANSADREDLIKQFCDAYKLHRSYFILTYDEYDDILTLLVSPVMPGRILSLHKPNLPSVGHINSDTKFRCGFHKDKNRFYLIPDGGHNLFGLSYLWSTNQLSDEAQAFIEESSRINTSLMYNFVKDGDRVLLYVSIAPNMGEVYLESLKDCLDKCMEKMELLSYVASSQVDEKIDFVFRKNELGIEKIMCRLTKQYDIDINAFGPDNSQKVLEMLSDAYCEYFGDTMDVESGYKASEKVYYYRIFCNI